MAFGGFDYTAAGDKQLKNVTIYGADGVALAVTGAGGITVNTELPAARLAADNLTNPTAPDVLSWPILFDGTVGKRQRGFNGIPSLIQATAANDGRDTTVGLFYAVTDVSYGGITYGYLFDGTSFNRARGNIAGTLLVSAARTATNSTAQQTNFNGSQLHVIINVTSITSSPSIVPTIEALDSVAGDYYTLLTGVAIVGTGKTVLKVGPGLLAAANAVAQDMVPRLWRVTLTHGNADSMTYSVAYALNCS